MNAQRRSRKNLDLEKNLYKSGAYFRYKHPKTGKFHGMGTDKARANAAARKLNSILEGQSDLALRVLSASGANKFGVLLTRYKDEYLPTKRLKEKTRINVIYQLNRLEKDLSETPVSDLSVQFISNYLDTGFQNNAYIKMRVRMIDIFRYARTKGLIDTNPAEHTLNKVANDKSRKPLTREWYDAIYAASPDWMRIAMDLALVTLQRRGDICMLKYDDISNGHIHIVQQKTEKHGIRARLRIQMTPTIADIITRSRADGIVSPFVIHRRPKRVIHCASISHWAQVRDEILSKSFATYRDKVPAIAALPIEQRPTFHEIRALGGHLYLEAGFSREYVQTLMGHSTGKMTAHYTDRHEEWTSCDASLEL